MITPERRAQLRTKALEHLEAARACIDESGDGMSNYLIERAIDELTSQLYPGARSTFRNLADKKKTGLGGLDAPWRRGEREKR
jgi:hypothetical protein